MNNKASACPICKNNENHTSISTRNKIPILQNIVFADKMEALSFEAGKMEAVQCNQCCFVWNKKFDPDLLIYDEDYDNDVSSSAYYQTHLEKMAHKVINSIPKDNPIYYVEIGCGEASFMRLVKELAGDRCISAIGFDPSYSGKNGALPSGLRVHQTYFSDKQFPLLPPQTNIICSRHTIEHIASPYPFAEALAVATKKYQAILHVETPDVDWIFANGAFQDFFFEHCSLFNPSSMAYLFQKFGLIGDVETVYNDQYMWGTFTELPSSDINKSDKTNMQCSGMSYQKMEDILIQKWKNKVQQQKKLGKVAVWGAASKGVTFILLLNQDEQLISHAIDLNKNKQNHYLPLTGIKVISPEEAMLEGITTIIVMNPNYFDEISTRIKKMDWLPTIISL